MGLVGLFFGVRQTFNNVITDINISLQLMDEKVEYLLDGEEEIHLEFEGDDNNGVH